jgi:hypothetical protein
MIQSQMFAPSVVYRLRRAHDQIQELNNMLGGILEDSPNRAVVDFKPEDEGTYRLTIKAVIWGLPPFELSVLLSEIIHNLRAALDNLVCALVYSQGGMGCDDSAFPMQARRPDDRAKSKPRSRQRRGNRVERPAPDPLAGIHPDARAIIQGLQPYQSTDPKRDLLWVLNQLSNIDKHRFFHVAAWALGAAEFEVIPVRHVTNITHQKILHTSGRVSLGTPLAEAIVHSHHPQPEVQVKTDFGLDIAFDETSTIVPNTLVGPLLRDISRYVIGIAESFERFLPPPIATPMSPEQPISEWDDD